MCFFFRFHWPERERERDARESGLDLRLMVSAFKTKVCAVAFRKLLNWKKVLDFPSVIFGLWVQWSAVEWPSLALGFFRSISKSLLCLELN